MFYRKHLSTALSCLCFLVAIVGIGEQLPFTMLSAIMSLHHRPKSHGASQRRTETSDKPEQTILLEVQFLAILSQ